MYDVAIVGSGPAGSTLARLLGSRHRVLLVDRRRMDRPAADVPAKLCGGLLAPAAQAELARQGLGVPAAVTSGPQLFAVRTHDARAGLERLYQRHYLNVERAAFDTWLAALAGRSAECAFGLALTGLVPQRDGHLLELATASGARTRVVARTVVAADGAASVVRRLTMPGATPARYVAVQAEFAGTGSEPFYGAVFDEEITDHYGWVVPKGGRLLVGVALPAGPDARGRFDRIVERVKDAGWSLGERHSLAAAPVLRPRSARDVALAAPCAFAIGEAAGLISPSSAEGISYALRSAAALAEALAGGLEGAEGRYRSIAAPLRAEVGAKVAKAAMIGSPAVRRCLMASGLGALPPAGSGTLSGSIAEVIGA